MVVKYEQEEQKCSGDQRNKGCCFPHEHCNLRTVHRLTLGPALAYDPEQLWLPKRQCVETSINRRKRESSRELLDTSILDFESCSSFPEAISLTA